MLPRATMLWAVFFHGGAALHSSLDRSSIADMGKAAESHGCVHEEDYRAEEMFHLVGQSGYGLVDQISEQTGRPTGRQVSAYKTLIIIGPTERWDSGQPGTQQADTGVPPQTADHASDSRQPEMPIEDSGATVQADPVSDNRDMTGL